MKKHLLQTIFFLIFIHGTHAQTITLHLKPGPALGKDAYLSSYGPNTNYGTHEELSGDAWTCGGNPCFARNLIQFDLSSIPANASILSANLSLHANTSPANGGGIAMQGVNACFLQRVTSSWSEGTVTWNSAPSTTTVDEVTIPQSTADFQDYPNINVTNLVQDMVNDPSNSYGFMLRLVNEVYFSTMIFASSDFPDSTKWPEITIQYTATAPTCLTLYASEGKDAYLSSDAPSMNFGSHPEFSGDAWTCNGSPCFGRGLLYFNLVGIPTTATVTSAHLSLHANPSPVNGGGVAMQGSNEAELIRITSSWQESTVTWNTAPATSSQNAVILNQSTSSFQDYLNIDVKNLVQDMVSNPSSSFGFMLQLTNEVYYSSMIFASSDYPDTSLQPVLQVCFSTVGINELDELSNQFKVFPNPTLGDIYVQYKLNRTSNVKISVVDVEGRLINAKEFGNVSSGPHTENLYINEESLSPGIYFVSFQSDQIRVCRKLIKY